MCIWGRQPSWCHTPTQPYLSTSVWLRPTAFPSRGPPSVPVLSAFMAESAITQAGTALIALVCLLADGAACLSSARTPLLSSGPSPVVFVPLLHRGGNSAAFSRSDPQLPLLVVYKMRDRATASLLTALTAAARQPVPVTSTHFLLKQNKTKQEPNLKYLQPRANQKALAREDPKWDAS